VGGHLIAENMYERLIAEQIERLLAEHEERKRRVIARAEQGDVDAQFRLAMSYEKGEDGFERDIPAAISWAQKAYRNGHVEAKKLYRRLILQDFVYARDVRILKSLVESVKTACVGDFPIKCAFDKLWKYMDVTGDGQVSLAEIARFQRNIVKFVAVTQKSKILKTEEIAAINLASIMLTPITATAVLNSFDYDGDGRLSKNEVLGDMAFAEILGLDATDAAEGIDFESLGQRMRDLLNQMPLFNN